MNKKINKIKGKALLLTLCLSLMSIAGCGGSNETSGNNETQAQTTQEVESTEAVTDAIPSGTVSVDDMLKSLKICGIDVSLPRKVGELPEEFTLQNGIVSSGTAIAKLCFQGNAIGTIRIYGVKSEQFPVSYRDEYRDLYIGGFTLDSEKNSYCTYEIMGVSQEATKTEIIGKLGCPYEEKGNKINYKSQVSDKGYNGITFYFDANETIASMMIVLKAE